MIPHKRTRAVPHNADDPAIWINRAEPGKSLIVGTDKSRENGGLVVFNLDGEIVQRMGPLDRPNNVDVEFDFSLAGKSVDLAVVSEREADRMRVYAIDPLSGELRDVSGRTAVFDDRKGRASEPMGVGLYRRPGDGAVFAIVSARDGPARDFLHQYILVDRGGLVDLEFVRAFGRFAGGQEIEAVCVDDPLGFVYYADEGYGIHKYSADPDKEDAGRELAVFARDGFSGDHEGIAVYSYPDGTGWIFCTEQLKGGSRLHVFNRLGTAQSPHEHRRLSIIQLTSDDTDGIDISSTPLGPGYPDGILAAMNNADRNFWLYRMGDVLDGIEK